MHEQRGGGPTYAYDAAGELASEYAAQPATLGTEYLTADQLGSTRLITSGTAMPSPTQIQQLGPVPPHIYLPEPSTLDALSPGGT
jgi:hypothetical protein